MFWFLTALAGALSLGAFVLLCVSFFTTKDFRTVFIALAMIGVGMISVLGAAVAQRYDWDRTRDEQIQRVCSTLDGVADRGTLHNRTAYVCESGPRVVHLIR